MNEPSVLDYLKSKLGMGAKIELPADDFLVPQEGEVEVSTPPQSEVKEIAVERKPKRYSPLGILLPIFFALIGQRAFEPPPNRSSTTGLSFYFIALSLLALAYYRKEWRMPTLRKSERGSYNSSFRLLAFFLASFFAIAAFLTFGRNTFSFINTFPWLLSILLFILAFWQDKTSLRGEINKVKSFFKVSNWSWLLLVFLLIGTTLFFRLYQTGTVPPEPFSDHAEKILDVYDISQGHNRIFFPRNTGREAIQMYWTLLVANIFGTKLSFFSLKFGTALLGLLTLPYIYLLGKEIANKRVGYIATFLMGISYWHNTISRVGLRFPLYPLFVAPVLFYLLRGIRRKNRNDFILAGLFLGLGAHGYSPFRIMPFVVLAAIGLYILHKESRGFRKGILTQLSILVLFSLVIFLPLGRYALEYPDLFSTRALSRLGDFGAGSFEIFSTNFWNGLLMFNWNNGNIWVHSVGGRPALGVVSAVFFIFGVVFLLVRYLQKRNWLDLFLPLSILLLTLPSTLSIAFPEENPALNRAGGAAVIVFVVAALAFDGLLSSLKSRAPRKFGVASTWILTILLFSIALFQNYDLVFNQYADTFRQGSWNSSEMGQVIVQFEEKHGQTRTVWIVPYPHWVDTRLPGVWAGIPNRDFALWQFDLEKSLAETESPKLFIINLSDSETVEILRKLYPDGVLSQYASTVPKHDFFIYRVP
ncbi:MAG: hypothetical protein HN392_09490 [Anaerolineae bacterium]|mgnify:CR=1 FL=1|jgi:hypothetical protein|nr:hypothetical protein [Anaerolineae bacterium]MBT7073571.1 hypothetical protein [Anaerolineae bacterium]MBT7599756.1 hypothetical protein [Anaerolineae bacterium]MBT7782535.1 hypothetical protein [Anaerolineae bacterium]